MSLFLEQYQLIQDTRETLFSFLEGIPQEKLHAEVKDFGQTSIMRTHIHVAGCYLYWLGNFARSPRLFTFPSEEEISHADVSKVRTWFAVADGIVEDFIATHDHRWLEPISNRVSWQADPVRLTPLWLLTHTMTHEFHHKGQIVSMARQLGYAPPDTDLVL